jgi:hypothetical protein
MRPGVAWFALAASLLAAGAGAQPAAPGHYEGQLCVATQADAEPSCGAAEVDMASARRLNVRVSDIVYRLALRGAQLEVTTMHGTMQIDEFSAAYKWSGDTLFFGDPAKDARYEVRVGARKRSAGS